LEDKESFTGKLSYVFTLKIVIDAI
jgi:hypothetical protein